MATISGKGNTAIGCQMLTPLARPLKRWQRTQPHRSCRHWIAHNSVYCEETGRIIGGGRDDQPLILGQIGTRLAVHLLWQSITRRFRAQS